MLSKQLAATLMTLAGLALAGTARADDDVIRLKGSQSSATTMNLKGNDADADANLYDVARFYGGRFYGGYRGFYGGRAYYRGYRGYYGGYRGFYGGRRFYGYRGFYGGYYPGYYAGYGYGGYGGYGYGYPYYGGYGGYGYGGYGYGGYASYGYGYGGYGGYGYGGYGGYGYGGYPCCAKRLVASVSRTVIQQQPVPVQPNGPIQQVPQNQGAGPGPGQVVPQVEEGTYPYNGGPRNSVPMPGATNNPQQPLNVPQVTPQAAQTPRLVPYDSLPDTDRYVSLPAAKKTGKWTYPAYGEQARRK
jgi:hypothetical protein